MRDLDLKSINLTVVDSENGKLIPDLLVYHFVVVHHVYRPKFLLIIPSLELKYEEKMIVANQYYTDSNGIVKIPDSKLKIDKKYFLYSDNISVNFDIDLDKVPNYGVENKNEQQFERKYYMFYGCMTAIILNRDKFFMPNKKYRGAYVVSGIKRDEEYFQQSEEEFIDFYWDDHWYQEERGDRNITVHLKHNSQESIEKVIKKREEFDRRIKKELEEERQEYERLREKK